ncbi:uncharacterized protein DUF3151 [Haloactinopolyspora alba]|uniref:Uncharacterized protein DUF3151 n=1 Tax=Haloactinopolyspora alba TaxID=648780 RepID=A0A2P8DYX2_9ACTN|nr:DUF3151 domain-containing protein [Haloactinopolyspora alba]PSL02414.1 uncharacterized protein DUF3151 [Haloactinopolyspora alba]
MPGEDLLGGPPETHLPDDEATAREALESGIDPATVAASHPSATLAWAELADRAFVNGDAVTSYAFARTGYHRGLDKLRRAGWKGHGPVPWEHVPNRGFLRALYALGRAAESIGETDEATRCAEFLRDSSPTAASELT